MFRPPLVISHQISELGSHMSKKRVLLVDDSAETRRAVRPLFDSHPKFEVVGEAEHGREAVEKAPVLRPDLIVLDLSMPVMNGFEAARLLIQILPNVWIILFTAHEFPEVYRLLREVGIHAVVPKSKATTHLIPQAEAFFEQGENPARWAS
jgi:two-component system, NarL family, nitrate/nitrite response regulator NarL